MTLVYLELCSIITTSNLRKNLIKHFSIQYIFIIIFSLLQPLSDLSYFSIHSSSCFASFSLSKQTKPIKQTANKTKNAETKSTQKNIESILCWPTTLRHGALPEYHRYTR